MKNWIILLFLTPLLSFGQAPKLSDEAEIHIVTCGPYQGELYSAFGHSAIRVYDPIKGYNIIYNYGVFDFTQPNFYLNFTKGHLNYQLARAPYNAFVQAYIRENRYVHEQVLNLRAAQKQKVFDFLEWNAQPENKNYFYDYFYNNCATKIKDGIKDLFQDSVIIGSDHITTEYSIRDLMDLYLSEQPWGDLGIDVCLGMTIDKKVVPEVYMFLPDYIEEGLNNSFLIQADGKKEPLIKETIITYKTEPEAKSFNWNTPILHFTIILMLGVLITVRGVKRNKNYFGFDIIVFSIIGLLGWLLTVLWFFTDHHTAAYNFNIIWAFPLHFPMALLLIKSVKFPFLRSYFRFMSIVYGALLLAWFWLPQDLNDGLLPFVLLLLIRSLWVSRRLKQNNS